MTDNKVMREAAGKEVFDKYGLHPEMPEVFDNSISNELNQCWRKGYLRYFLARVPTGVNHAMLFGSTWHKMQEGKAFGLSVAECEEIADSMLPEAIDDKFNRTRSRIKEAFQRYGERFDAEDGSMMEVIRTEQAADLTCLPNADCFLGGCDLSWGGKMDRLVRLHGRLWILDFKTSAYKDDYFGEKIALNHQLRGYAWLLSHLMGERVWGVMIDRAVINSSAITFTRYPHAISDGHMMSFVRNQQSILDDAARKFRIGAYDLNVWQENPDECFNRGRCPYYGVCSTSPWPDTEARLKVISNDYEEKRHDFYNL